MFNRLPLGGSPAVHIGDTSTWHAVEITEVGYAAWMPYAFEMFLASGELGEATGASGSGRNMVRPAVVGGTRVGIATCATA